MAVVFLFFYLFIFSSFFFHLTSFAFNSLLLRALHRFQIRLFLFLYIVFYFIFFSLKHFRKAIDIWLKRRHDWRRRYLSMNITTMTVPCVSLDTVASNLQNLFIIPFYFFSFYLLFFFYFLSIKRYNNLKSFSEWIFDVILTNFLFCLEFSSSFLFIYNIDRGIFRRYESDAKW